MKLEELKAEVERLRVKHRETLAEYKRVAELEDLEGGAEALGRLRYQLVCDHQRFERALVRLEEALYP